MIRQNFLRFCSIALAFAMPMASASAALVPFAATLRGTNENPVNNSPAIGSMSIILDDVANTLTINGSFSGLTGNTTQAHIHAPAGVGVNAGVAVGNPSLPGFPIGVTNGSQNNAVVDLNNVANFNNAFVTNNGGTVATARAAFLTALNAGNTYFNIHTSTFGGGEIRGQLIAVPEPSTCALVGIASLLFAARRRWKMKKLNAAVG